MPGYTGYTLTSERHGTSDGVILPIREHTGYADPSNGRHCRIREHAGDANPSDAAALAWCEGEIDTGKLRRCIAGGPEASSGSCAASLVAEIGTPRGMDRAGGENKHARGPQGQGSRAGLCTTRHAAAQLACVDLSSLPRSEPMNGLEEMRR